jgi:uncharacterized membrane protein
MLTTTAVVLVMWRRQFASKIRAALLAEDDGTGQGWQP